MNETPSSFSFSLSPLPHLSHAGLNILLETMNLIFLAFSLQGEEGKGISLSETLKERQT